jgi:hypothetical protein
LLASHQLASARRRAINAAHAQARGKAVHDTCIDTTKHLGATATSAHPAVMAGMRFKPSQDLALAGFLQGRITCAVLIHLIFSTMDASGSFQKRSVKEPLNF